jgi:NADH-quinone oxidoreductase subunit K
MNGAAIYEQPAVYLILAAMLLAIGLVGLIRRRTLIGMLISGEILFIAASLNFLAVNRFFSPDPAVGQVCVLFLMGLAAAEVSVGLSIVIAVYRNYRSIRSRDLSEMNG